MCATRVADLESFNADLRHRERQDLNLLETTVNNDAGVDATRVDGQRVGEQTVDRLDLELLEEHPGNRFCQLAHAAEALYEDDALVFGTRLEHMVERGRHEFFDFVLQALLLEPEHVWERGAVQFAQVLPDTLRVVLWHLISVNVLLMLVVKGVHHGQGRLEDVKRHRLLREADLGVGETNIENQVSVLEIELPDVIHI